MIYFPGQNYPDVERVMFLTLLSLTVSVQRSFISGFVLEKDLFMKRIVTNEEF